VFKREVAGRLFDRRRDLPPAQTLAALTGYADVARELEAHRIASPTAREISDAVIAIRSRKLPDPARIGNAGSFFKNPVVDAAAFAGLAARHPGLPHYPQPDGTVKLAAGWLIERCGWRGKALGWRACTSIRRWCWSIAAGRGDEDVLRLARAIQESVRAVFGWSWSRSRWCFERRATGKPSPTVRRKNQIFSNIDNIL